MMKRVILICWIGLGGAISSHGFPLSEDVQAPGKPALKKAEQERLCVTIWSRKTRIPVGEPFDVTLRVVNAAEKPQFLRVMSCSWFQHWKNNNSRMVWSGGIPVRCPGNTELIIKLEPGEAYEKHVQMVLEEGSPLITTSFQMGFTPLGETKIYWSNKLSRFR